MESIWRHVLLEGEYPPRERAVKGIPLDAAGAIPEGASNSIYQELMHLIGWHKVILSLSEAMYKEWMSGERFPAETAPADEAEWEAKVEEYLSDLAAIAEAAEAADPSTEIGPDITLGEIYTAMTTHNAYHVGKIVALRQSLGCWPAEEKK